MYLDELNLLEELENKINKYLFGKYCNENVRMVQSSIKQAIRNVKYRQESLPKINER